MQAEYRFFPTSLEYHQGFFTVEQETIDYRAITVSPGAKDGSIARMVSYWRRLRDVLEPLPPHRPGGDPPQE